MKHTRKITAIIGILAIMAGLSAILHAAQPKQIPVWQTEAYGPKQHQLLDILAPEPGPHPTIILIHPGGWDGGERLDMHAYAPFMPHWTVISVSYTLGHPKRPSAKRAIADIHTAINYAKRHLSVDPNRIALVGASAGGHLALMAGLGRDDVVAIASLAGPLDLTNFVQTSRNPRLVKNLLGLNYTPDDLRDASPAHAIEAKMDQPILIVQGATDPLVPPSPAHRVAENAPHVTLLRIPGSHWQAITSPLVLSTLTAFLDECFAKT